MWGTLETAGSRNGSNARALVVPDFGDLRRLFEPVEGQASNLLSVGPCGLVLGRPRLCICESSRGLGELALEALISKMVRGGG
jgi:hypothetical protein